MERISNRVIAVLFFNIIYSNKKFINIIIIKMDSSISIKEQEKNYEEVLDGIIKNEPVKNKYLPVGYHKMNTFPYFLIGKIVSKYEIEETI